MELAKRIEAGLFATQRLAEMIEAGLKASRPAAPGHAVDLP